VITAGLLRAAGVTVTGVDIDALDLGLTTGPRHGHASAQATARIEFTTAGSADRRTLCPHHPQPDAAGPGPTTRLGMMRGI
jgi:hypothetical protein